MRSRQVFLCKIHSENTVITFNRPQLGDDRGHVSVETTGHKAPWCGRKRSDMRSLPGAPFHLGPVGPVTPDDGHKHFIGSKCPIDPIHNQALALEVTLILV